MYDAEKQMQEIMESPQLRCDYEQECKHALGIRHFEYILLSSRKSRDRQIQLYIQ